MNPARRAFHEIIQIALEEGITTTNFARRFEVATSTVIRWAKGKANPHPLLRRQIVWHVLAMQTSEALKKKMQEYLDLKYVCENCKYETDNLHSCPLKKNLSYQLW